MQEGASACGVNGSEGNAAAVDGTEGSEVEGVRQGAEQGESTAQQFFRVREGESARGFARRIFDHCFGSNVERALALKDMWKGERAARKPTPLFLRQLDGQVVDALLEGKGKGEDKRGEGEGEVEVEGEVVSAADALGLTDSQAVWSREECAAVFIKSIELFLEKRKEVRRRKAWKGRNRSTCQKMGRGWDEGRNEAGKRRETMEKERASIILQ